MQFLDHKSDFFHSVRVLKFKVSLYFAGFMAECLFCFNFQETEKLNFSPKGLRTVKI